MFDGSTYIPEWDEKRLKSLLGRVFLLMRDGQWRTLTEIQLAVGGSQPGISARLRDFRKDKFGGHQVDRQRFGNPEDGVFEYRLVVREPDPQMNLFREAS
jgi:hypothetical protein